MQFLLKSSGSFFLVLLLSACVQNPVTGESNFLLVSEDWELQVGAQQYAPLRQQQGGDYITDAKVTAYVRAVGNKLAAVSDRKLPYEFNVINDSTPNAWALPGGKISINRGLLVELNSEAELAAVLGHEIVHAAAKHGARGQTRNLGLQAGVVTATLLADSQGYNAQVAQMASSVGSQLINSQYGQGAELESDLFGMEYMSRAGYDPQGAVELQQTFVRLSQGSGSNALERLFASHPPSQKRVDENRATAARLPQGGFKGVQEYRRTMATLFNTREAYEAADQARLALQQGDTRKASSLVQTAIRIEPRESLFQSIAGDIALSQNNMNAAKQAYTKAISLNGNYFYNFVQRGSISEAQRDNNAARADYARSVSLLPTANAQLGLGKYAEARGDTQVARRFYSMAAQADNNVGVKARQALLRVQPDNNSSRETALMVTQGLTRKGTFAIQIVNQTSQQIGNIRLGVTVANSQQRTLSVRQQLRPGEKRLIETGQKLTSAQANRVKVVVLGADVVGR